MQWGSNNKDMTRQDMFKPTAVTFEGEGGVDMAEVGGGGLTNEMVTAFVRGRFRTRSSSKHGSR